MRRNSRDMVCSEQEWRDSLAELVQKPRDHHLKLQFTKDQDEALLEMRRAGVPYAEIAAFFKKHWGFGCRQTMAQRVAELEGTR